MDRFRQHRDHQGRGDHRWVVANTTAAGSTTTPISVLAVNQDDPTRLVRLDPWGTVLPPGVPASESPGSFGVDPDNNMIYAQDWFVNGVFGIKLDQPAGNMEVVWSRSDWRAVLLSKQNRITIPV